MKNTYFVISLCMLLLLGTFLTSAINYIPTTAPLDVKDQFQETSDECKWFGPFAWQEFQPVGVKHLRVEVRIKQGYEQSPPLKLTLEQPLGNVLTAVNVVASDIPTTCDWVKFDFPDVDVDIANTVFINLSFAPGGEYAWCGGNGDPYPQGTSSEGLQWDWCFRSFVDKSDATPSASLAFNNIQSSNTVIGRLLTRTFIFQILNNILLGI